MNRAKMMALMAAVMMSPATESRSYMPTETDEEKQREIKERNLKNLEKKGVQKFVIDGKEVYARDYKNALRKANRGL